MDNIYNATYYTVCLLVKWKCVLLYADAVMLMIENPNYLQYMLHILHDGMIWI